MTYDECRQAWPDKVFWANINLGQYALPEERLREAVISRRERAGKQGLAFEISEDVPENWHESIPLFWIRCANWPECPGQALPGDGNPHRATSSEAPPR